MNFFDRLFGSPMFETYVLNLSQLLHMAILAAVVPWYIGVASYGIFSALIALPGLIQSSFEVICVAILSEFRRRDLLRRVILFFAAPLLLGVTGGFFALFDFQQAMIASLMAVLLLMRSYAFSIAIVSGALTKRIVQSEAIVLVIYACVLALCVAFGVNDERVPIFMVIGSSFTTSVFLIWSSRSPIVGLTAPPDDSQPRLPVSKLAHASGLRLFEDGFLTLPPLVLALVLSPAVAGQFRIFVSAAKLVYKFYPFRYEVVLRDLNSGALALRALSIAALGFVVSAPFAAAILHLFLGLREYGVIGALIPTCGMVVASLSMFPAAASIEYRMLLLATAYLVACFGAAYFVGTAGFVVAYTLSCALISGSAWLVIKGATRNR